MNPKITFKRGTPKGDMDRRLAEGRQRVGTDARSLLHARRQVPLVHAPADGVREACPIAFAEPKRAMDAAIACVN